MVCRDGRLDLHDQAVLLCIFLEFVAHSANNAFDFGLEKLLERADRDRRRLSVRLLDPLLVVQDRHDLGVVVPVLFRVFAVVEVDQHVGQVLVQSVLDRLSVLLGLVALRLLLLLRRVLALGMGVVMLGRLRLVGSVSSVVVVVARPIGLVAVKVLRAIGAILRPVGARGALSVAVTRVTLAVLGGGGLTWLAPLLFVFNLVADVVFIAFFVAIETFFFRVFFLAFFLAFLVIGLSTHVLLLDSLRHLLLVLLLLLLHLGFLLLTRIPFLLVNQVVHRDHWLLAIILSSISKLSVLKRTPPRCSTYDCWYGRF